MDRRNIIDMNRRRCVNALILCTVVIAGVFIGVVTKLVAESTALDPDEGIRSFRYFTVLSNILMAFTATLCIPFEIDGLRNHNYHLPRWIVDLLYCGVCCVSITFFFAVCLLAPTQGILPTLFQKAGLYLHFICPVAAILLFIFVNDDHRIPFQRTFLALVPLLAYAFLYWLKVFAVGAENGGWRDHYYTNVYFPYWISMVAVPLLGFALANGIRILHNKRHQKKKAETEFYYAHGSDFACGDIHEAIAYLAMREKPLDRGGEITVPRRLLLLLEKGYQSGLPVEELCQEYLSDYLRDSDCPGRISNV